MGKSGYTGGGTIIGAHTPEWFGNGAVELPIDEKHLSAVAKLERLQGERHEGKTGRHHRRKLAETRREVDETTPRPARAVERKPLDGQAEQRIAGLKRDLAAFASQARSAIQQHEEARLKLVRLLDEYGLSPKNYPETGKLKP